MGPLFQLPRHGDGWQFVVECWVRLHPVAAPHSSGIPWLCVVSRSSVRSFISTKRDRRPVLEWVRLPCRDGLERRDGGQGKIALQEPTPPRARAAPPKPVRPVKVPVEVEQPPPPRQPSMPVVARIGR